MKLSAELMYKHISTYVKEFNSLCNLITYVYDIDQQDAQDIVQNAYIEASNSESPKFEFYITWKGRAKWRALDFKHNVRNRCKTDIFSAKGVKTPDKTLFELDLTKFVDRKSEKKVIELYASGMDAHDIAEEIGISQSTARSYLSRGLDNIRRHLINEL